MQHANIHLYRYVIFDLFIIGAKNSLDVTSSAIYVPRMADTRENSQIYAENRQSSHRKTQSRNNKSVKIKAVQMRDNGCGCAAVRNNK